MTYTSNFIDRYLAKADEAGKNNRNDEQKLQDILDQLVQSVEQGVYKLKKTYDQPLNDYVLRPFCEANYVIVKENININKRALQNITKYEYTFIYKQGDEILEYIH